MIPNAARSGARAAWSLRVRRIGGLIQVAFAAYWLVRGSLAIGGPVGAVLAAVSGVGVVALFGWVMVATAGTAPRPTSPEGRRIERAITIATVLQLVASFAAPALVIALGHSDWVLPSVAITIGPLLLWLDHRVDVPRYRPVGWALIVVPFVLVVVLSGAVLTAVTGIAAGVLMLATACAGFRELGATHRTAPPVP